MTRDNQTFADLINFLLQYFSVIHLTIGGVLVPVLLPLPLALSVGSSSSSSKQQQQQQQQQRILNERIPDPPKEILFSTAASGIVSPQSTQPGAPLDRHAQSCSEDWPAPHASARAPGQVQSPQRAPLNAVNSFPPPP